MNKNKGYWIALYKKIENLEKLKQYSLKVTPIIKKHGGVPLVRGGNYKFYSGDEFPRTVIWEFHLLNKIYNFHLSPKELNHVSL